MLARQLNPADTSRFVADMSVLPVEHQADVALGWRERCVNAINTLAPTPAQETAHYGTAVLYAGAIGAWDGRNEAARDKLVKTWQDSTAVTLGVNTQDHPTPFKDIKDLKGVVIHKAIPDPREFFGVNKTLIPTAAAAVTAVGLAAFGTGDAVSPYLKAAIMSGVGYATGNIAREIVRARSAAAKPAAAKNGATNGGTTSNPGRYGGYPRVA